MTPADDRSRPARESSRASLGECLLVLLVGLAAAGIFWRDTLSSRFEVISGNLGDNRLIIALHEHWFAVFRGRDVWDRPLFFWGADHVLGFSDGMFLSAIPYAVLRSLGLDPYVAFQIVLVSLTLLAFVAGHVLFRRELALPRTLALLGAIVLAFSTQIAFGRYAAQNLYVCLGPVLLLLASSFLRDVEAARARALVFGVPLAVLLALTFFSSFNFAWFFTFFLLLVGVLCVAGNARRSRGLATRRRMVLLLSTVAVFVVALLPFLVTYLPLVSAGFVRGYDQAIPHLLEPAQLLNRSSVLWRFGRPWVGARSLENYALTPGVVLVFLLACVHLWRHRRQPTRNQALPLERLLAPTAIAVVLATTLVVRAGEHSLWWFVYEAVPGASANRAVMRFLYVIGLFTVIVAFGYLGRIARAGRRGGRAAALLVGVVLVLEQYADHPVDLISRDAEVERIQRVPFPPPGTSVFFVVMAEPEGADRRSKWPNIVAQIDAMLVAERFGIPTLNGYSGWYPRGWDLAPPIGSEVYLERTRAWLARHEIRGRVAALDLARRRWLPLGPIRTARVADST